MNNDNDSENVLSDNFLLNNQRSQELYFEFAKNAPCIDYHGHIDPKAMADNLYYASPVEYMLGSKRENSPAYNHYLARLLIKVNVAGSREASEDLVLGRGVYSSIDTDKKRFELIIKSFPKLAASPTYHWEIRALIDLFNFREIPNENNWKKLYEIINEKLKKLSIRDILKSKNIVLTCTTDAVTDNLKFHKRYAEENNYTKMYPGFRPDAFLTLKNTLRNKFLDNVKKLSSCENIEINNLETLLIALKNRHQYFVENGCRICDFGILQMPVGELNNFDKANISLIKALKEESLTDEEEEFYFAYVLTKITEWNFDSDLTSIYHQGAGRDADTIGFIAKGADSGSDYAAEALDIQATKRFLDYLKQKNKLGRIIISPIMEYVFRDLAILLDSFGGNSQDLFLNVPWWFADHKNGITRWLDTLADITTVSTSLGFLADGRTAHLIGGRFDYFKRVLCSWISEKMPEFTKEEQGKLIEGICYKNAEKYFRFI